MKKRLVGLKRSERGEWFREDVGGEWVSGGLRKEEKRKGGVSACGVNTVRLFFSKCH